MDTNALIWFMNGDPLSQKSLEDIAQAQRARKVYVSPISGWEAALALRKRSGQPNLGGMNAGDWFKAVLGVPGVRLITQNQGIALEAANVPGIYGRGDPGDCFLIAAAHVRKLSLVTRDRAILALAARRPDYLQAIEC